MVDREFRDLLAESLRHLAAGVITNDAFEDIVLDVSLNSDDEASWPLFQAGWCLYSDMRTYRLRGRDALSRDERRIVARWIAFLYSDLQYEWPDEERLVPKPGCLMSLMTFGRANRQWRDDLKQALHDLGDYDLWPFLRESDFEAALQRPRLLTGVDPGGTE